MSRKLTMIEISYDFQALQMDMESGSLKFNMTINEIVKDGLSQKELQGLDTTLGEVEQLGDGQDEVICRKRLYVLYE